MIEIENLSKSYVKGKLALDHINLKVTEGTMMGIVGENGSGKTTLFKIMCGLITDYEGKCLLFHRKSDITIMPQISYMPEVRGLDTRAYVLEHLTELLMYKGYSRKISKEAILVWLERFHMEKYRYQKIGSLSKGNQQKLQLVLSLANQPKLLILDEPFSGLDIAAVDFLMDVLNDINKKGCTILFSSHDLYNSYTYCNQFLFMSSGKICEQGTLDEIQERKPMILELRNETVKEDNLYRIAGKNNVSKIQQEYSIKITDLDMAKAIFNTLDDKFSEKFYVRKMSISEIFKEICR